MDARAFEAPDFCPYLRVGSLLSIRDKTQQGQYINNGTKVSLGLTFDEVESVDLINGKKQVLQEQGFTFLSFRDLGTDTAKVLDEGLSGLGDHQEGLFVDHGGLRVEIDDLAHSIHRQLHELPYTARTKYTFQPRPSNVMRANLDNITYFAAVT